MHTIVKEKSSIFKHDIISYLPCGNDILFIYLSDGKVIVQLAAFIKTSVLHLMLLCRIAELLSENEGDGYGLFIKREMDTVFRTADSR